MLKVPKKAIVETNVRQTNILETNVKGSQKGCC